MKIRRIFTAIFCILGLLLGCDSESIVISNNVHDLGGVQAPLVQPNPSKNLNIEPTLKPTVTPEVTRKIFTAPTKVPSLLDKLPAPKNNPTPSPSLTPVPSKPLPTLTEASVQSVIAPNVGLRSDPKFTITSKLCGDQNGPDCAALRLGDDYLTTTTPAKGYLYSCRGKNPNAPGSIESKIIWIDFISKTWNFLKKLWLPGGEFSPGIGTYEEAISDDKRLIEANNLPVDGKIGDWPMTNYPRLTSIDRNPGMPASRNFAFSYPIEPLEASSPSCVSLGAIGISKNGVVIYSAIDGRGEDAVAREIVDVFGGHPAQSDYHYHFIPERLDNDFLNDGHSGIVGYINDGFPLYGYKGTGGIEMSNDDLDICHGHNHGTLGYHYHATLEYPYTVGCYIGTPTISADSMGMSSNQQRPPRRGVPRRR